MSGHGKLLEVECGTLRVTLKSRCSSIHKWEPGYSQLGILERGMLLATTRGFRCTIIGLWVNTEWIVGDGAHGGGARDDS